jgi:phosphatidylethanolamine/phosphatidyl-N-methylethanolamine N-methyltransferase
VAVGIEPREPSAAQRINSGSMTHTFSDWLLFARGLLTAPGAVAAISPSSRGLARAMALDLGTRTGPVLEFGPGTGRLTQGLLEAGVPSSDLMLIELNSDFASLLRHRFAGVTVLTAGAQDAPRYAVAGSVGAVVSGLPLLSMREPDVEAVLHAAFTVLRPGGYMRQFTYGFKPPVASRTLRRLGLVARPLQQVWANLPPARVYQIERVTPPAPHTDLRP